MLRAPQYYAFTADNSTFGALRVAEGALEWPGIATAPFAVLPGLLAPASALYRSAAALGYARASALENDAASRKTEL